MKKFAIPFFLLGTLAMVYVMVRTGASLKTPNTPNGIIDLEFACNTEKTNTVINTWASINHEDTITAAKQNTWLDFIFIFFYAGFLFLAAKNISRSFGGFFGKAGKIVAKAVLAAALLDVLENTGMLITLWGNGSGTISFLTTTCSLIKWGLVILSVIYVLTGSVGLMRSKLKGRN